MADIQHLASLTEEDIKFRYITPAIESAGWQKNQIRMEYFFTDGRIISVGSEYERASRKKADYVLQLNNDNLLAVVEAKSATKDLTTGLQQAIGGTTAQRSSRPTKKATSSTRNPADLMHSNSSNYPATSTSVSFPSPKKKFFLLQSCWQTTTNAAKHWINR